MCPAHDYYLNFSHIANYVDDCCPHPGPDVEILAIIIAM